ncbi:MAG: hypothetical protein NT107_11390 [Planctomycetota bacterium]|nr:hypothetical protein [Planctomycetota bacterium]
MSPSATPPSTPPASWQIPIAIGALITTLLHLPAMVRHELWVPMCCCAGFLGAPLGMLPAALVLRKDPHLGSASGFAVSFISIGLGVIVPAAVTLWHGFRIDDLALDMLRDEWLQQGVSKVEVDKVLDGLLGVGPMSVVATAAIAALSAGVIGAVVAGLTDRRHRRRALPPPVPS